MSRELLIVYERLRGVAIVNEMLRQLVIVMVYEMFKGLLIVYRMCRTCHPFLSNEHNPDVLPQRFPPSLNWLNDISNICVRL